MSLSNLSTLTALHYATTRRVARALGRLLAELRDALMPLARSASAAVTRAFAWRPAPQLVPVPAVGVVDGPAGAERVEILPWTYETDPRGLAVLRTGLQGRHVAPGDRWRDLRAYGRAPVALVTSTPAGLFADPRERAGWWVTLAAVTAFGVGPILATAAAIVLVLGWW